MHPALCKWGQSIWVLATVSTRTFSPTVWIGTTTELGLKVGAEHESEARKEPVQILASNHPPVLPCEACGQNATQICSRNTAKVTLCL
jgi:hypothetical protein